MKNYIALILTVYTIGFAGLGFTVVKQQEQIIAINEQVISIASKVDNMSSLMNLSFYQLGKIKVKS